jgi:hypothetical protein
MYRHTQIGWLILATVGLPALLLLFSGAVLHGAWIPFSILFLVLVLFCVLTVEVNDCEVIVSFGPGLIRRRIRLEEIDACVPVSNRWWFGWGLRIIPGGVMFNVSGLDAVDLTLKNGTHFRIGTDEPERLLEAIENALSRR